MHRHERVLGGPYLLFSTVIPKTFFQSPLKMYSILAFTVCLFVKSTLSWGVEGHEIVGSIAQHFISSAAQSRLERILTESKGDLASVSVWADKVKYTSQYSATRPLHYIDVNDSPPNKCGVMESRDCADGNCIVGAIAKYSNQVVCSKDPKLQADGIKFLVHFFGDITQPLHNENRDKGGNSDKVIFDGKFTNLHSVWDTQLVQAQIEKQSSGSQDSYTNYLIMKIDRGSFKDLKSSWLSSHAFDEVSPNGNSLAALEYAQDSNQFDCGKNGVWSAYDRNPSQDFSGSYADIAAPIIDIQLAKGGYRLGMYLSQLLTSTCPSSRRIRSLVKH